MAEDLKTMEASLLTLKRQVEKVTALGLSWDTAVQLLVIAGLTEVSSQLDTLSKALSANAGHPVVDAAPSTRAAKRGRGRPKGKGHPVL